MRTRPRFVHAATLTGGLARATTSLNWDTTFGPVPATGGFVAQGDLGLMGVTNPDYYIDPGEIVAVEGYGSDWGGYFLGVDGGVTFSTAGLAAISAGSSSTTVTLGVDITPQSKVLATVQSSTGDLDRVIRHAGADSITIQLKAMATQTVTVAYFVIS